MNKRELLEFLSCIDHPNADNLGGDDLGASVAGMFKKTKARKPRRKTNECRKHMLRSQRSLTTSAMCYSRVVESRATIVNSSKQCSHMYDPKTSVILLGAAGRWEGLPNLLSQAGEPTAIAHHGAGRAHSCEYVCGEKLMSTRINAYHLT